MDGIECDIYEKLESIAIKSGEHICFISASNLYVFTTAFTVHIRSGGGFRLW